jgi:ubiquinone/menaquinone biosynthesis C-methylase UbiE
MTTDFDSKARTWDTTEKAERAQSVADGIGGKLKMTRDMTGFEYGCGTGLLSFCLRYQLGHITLADNSAGMLEVVAEKIQAAGITDMTPVQLDLMKEAAPETPFQLIYTMLTLHHIDDTNGIVGIFHAMLSEGGYLCIADLDKEDGSFHRGGFDGHHGFDQQQLKEKLERAGFTDVAFEICYDIKKEVEGGGTRSFPVFLMTCVKK